MHQYTFEISLCFRIANDDQYASNVPDTHDEATTVSSTTDVKGHQGSGLIDVDGENVKEVEVCYLAQLRRSQYPINGIYKLTHNSAHNHFRKHSDVKHRGRWPWGNENCQKCFDISTRIFSETNYVWAWRIWVLYKQVAFYQCRCIMKGNLSKLLYSWCH